MLQVEGKGLDRPWGPSPHPKKCDCGKHDGCKQPVCINDNGLAKSFPTVCNAVMYLHKRKKLKLIAIGLGECKTIYSCKKKKQNCLMKYIQNLTLFVLACLYTEWFDLDEPCKSGEVESVYVTNIFASRLGKYVITRNCLNYNKTFHYIKYHLQGTHRSCSSRGAKLQERPAQLRTVEGHEKVDQVYETDRDKIICYNKQNAKKPPRPYVWVDANVTCRDWKIRFSFIFKKNFSICCTAFNSYDAARYCCDNLWGEAVAPLTKGYKGGNSNVIVDMPNKETLFDECNWLSFMSAGSGTGQGDFESRAKNHPFRKKSTCNLDRFAALYIDSRRIKDDVPWDETGELITKNTPT